MLLRGQPVGFPIKSTVMNDKDKKIVNTEEQNRVVNPGDRQDNLDNRERIAVAGEPSHMSDASQPETEKPARESKSQRSHRTEGEDVGDTDRKKPNV